MRFHSFDHLFCVDGSVKPTLVTPSSFFPQLAIEPNIYLHKKFWAIYYQLWEFEGQLVDILNMKSRFFRLKLSLIENDLAYP